MFHCALLFHLNLRYDFDLCSGGDSWDQWFLKSCDWDILATQVTVSTVLRPQSRRPAAPAMFPACTRDHFNMMTDVYTTTVGHRKHVGLADIDAIEADEHPVDPVYSYVRARSEERKRALRAVAPEYIEYFDCLDRL